MYRGTKWVDHAVDPVTGAPVQQGTPQSAGNFNKIERGVSDASAALAAALIAAEQIKAEVRGKKTIRTARFVVGTSTNGWTLNDCDFLCDGTRDDVEINAAIKALPEGGGEVVILDGEYNVGADILVDKANVTLSGSGATIFTRTHNKSLANIIKVEEEGVKIQGIVFDGDADTFTGSILYLIKGTSTATNLTVRDCVFYRAHENAIFLSGTKNARITNNFINGGYGGISLSTTGTSSNGVDTWHHCGGTVVDGNFIENCTGYGILSSVVHDNMGVTICNNHVYACAVGIWARQGNIVVDNVCANNTGEGISISGNDDKNVIVANNMCVANGTDGIRFEVSSGTTVSSGHVVTENCCRDNVQCGIRVRYSYTNGRYQDITITGNVCVDNGGSGILLSNVHNSVISGNICQRGSGAAADYTNSQHTIELAATYNTNNLIVGNTIMGKNYTTGGGTGNTFVNNKYN